MGKPRKKRGMAIKKGERAQVGGGTRPKAGRRRRTTFWDGDEEAFLWFLGEACVGAFFLGRRCREEKNRIGDEAAVENGAGGKRADEEMRPGERRVMIVILLLLS